MNREIEDDTDEPQLQRTVYDTDDPLELMLEEGCRVASKSLPGLALEVVTAWLEPRSRWER